MSATVELNCVETVEVEGIVTNKARKTGFVVMALEESVELEGKFICRSVLTTIQL